MKSLLLVTTSVIVIALLSFTANAGKRQDKGPFATLLKSLDRIEASMSTVEDQLLGQSASLQAAKIRLDMLGDAAEQTRAGLKFSNSKLTELRDELADVRDLLGKGLPASSTLGHRVWVSPYWTDWINDSGDGPFVKAQIYHPANIVVFNPGDATTSIGCTFFEAGGNLILDRGSSTTAGAGATTTCTSTTASFEVGSGWMIVTADNPVFPYGWYMDGYKDQENRAREVMHFFPVDCSTPGDFEFVCQFANEG